MKAELEKKLLSKYAHFFTDELPIYTGDSREEIVENVKSLLNQKEMVLPIQFGIECGSGWYMLLDELMASIDNHIQNVNRNAKNEFKYKWMWELQLKLRQRARAVKSKWRDLADFIYKHAPKKKYAPMFFRIDQIKEKFSTLRFYYTGGDDEIAGMVSLAESLSAHICEYCGTTINVGRTSGWLITTCESCAIKHNNHDKWKKNLEE